MFDVDFEKYLPRNPIEDLIFGLVCVACASGTFVMKEMLDSIFWDILYGMFATLVVFYATYFIYHMITWHKETFKSE